jgi:1,4-alpha-glucan branching enzyme
MTPSGWAAFAREPTAARQVWSREVGYPGDPAYRDFYRDIGFDLDLDYLRPFLPIPDRRTPTGIKYHRVTGPGASKQIYDQGAALAKVAQHAGHFLDLLRLQGNRAGGRLSQPPLIVAPFDAELFGHWWYEGIDFLNCLVRSMGAATQGIQMITPTDYLAQYNQVQVATPAASSWGEGGYWRIWLNESNDWVQPYLRSAQRRMIELVSQTSSLPVALSFTTGQKAARGKIKGKARLENRKLAQKQQGSCKAPTEGGLQHRALQQAGRELLLAQSSDWTFMLYHRTTSDYARQRLLDHLNAFHSLHRQIQTGSIDEAALRDMESRHNLFPNLNIQHWTDPTTRDRARDEAGSNR